jgi:hypothetical protein
LQVYSWGLQRRDKGLNQLSKETGKITDWKYRNHFCSTFKYTDDFIGAVFIFQLLENEAYKVLSKK